ncbi:MAG: hypothetical protein AAGE52_27035 [Myxococcota bacterium]
MRVIRGAALGALLGAILVPWASLAAAHGGGLNRCGCHHNRSTGACHCHRARGCGCECEPRSCSTSDSADGLTERTTLGFSR